MHQVYHKIHTPVTISDLGTNVSGWWDKTDDCFDFRNLVAEFLLYSQGQRSSGGI